MLRDVLSLPNVGCRLCERLCVCPSHLSVAFVIRHVCVESPLSCSPGITDLFISGGGLTEWSHFGCDHS